jgi:hypothetical protein
LCAKIIKNKPCFLILDGMLVVNALFHAREDLRSKSLSLNKIFAHNIGDV